MKQRTITPSLLKLINLIDQALKTNGRLSPLKAKELVLAADVQVEDLMPYTDFNHPNEDSYGRKLVYNGEQFEVMVMSWNPGHYSSIHNHGYTQWGVVQVFGNTHHLVYHIKDDHLFFSKKEILPFGRAIKVNNALIHQMGNATTAPYLTLHVYGANERDKDITADAKNFDLEFDRIAYTCGGAFFNLPERAVHEIEGGVIPSQNVFMHYAYLLMDYYNRQKPSPEIARLKDHLLKRIRKSIFPLSSADTSLMQ